MSNAPTTKITVVMPEAVDGFFRAIDGWRSAYKRACLHFVGVKREGQIVLVSARIYLDAGGEANLPPKLSEGGFEAGHWVIPQEQISVETVIEQLLNPGGLNIEGIGTLVLARDGQPTAHFASANLFHPDGLQTGDRLGVLSILGAQKIAVVPQPDSDWRLRAGSLPFENVHELCVVYGLGSTGHAATTLEVVATTVVQVLASSEVKGTVATVGVWVANGLDRSKVRLGYRVLNKRVVQKRGSLDGKELVWRAEGVAEIGSKTLDISAGSVVQCIASYGGEAHQVAWRGDPNFFQNPRAAVLSTVDPGLTLLSGYLNPDQSLRNSASKDFEDAVSWLLWGFGFSTICFGQNSKTRDAPDIVAVSPRGDFLVVECTLGLLKADSKLSKLVARTAELRERLDESEIKHLRVLPVIVTAFTLGQVSADIAAAEGEGVFVVTRERFDDALRDLAIFPAADELYDRAFEQAMAKRRK